MSLRIYTKNNYLTETYNFSDLGSGNLRWLQKSIYHKIPAFIQKFSGEFDTVNYFYARKLVGKDFSAENTVEKTVTLSNSYIKIVDYKAFCSSQNITEVLESGLYILEYQLKIGATSTLSDIFYSEVFEVSLPACSLLTTYTTTNTYIKYLEVISGGLRVNCYVGNAYSFVQLQANYGVGFIDVGDVNLCVSATAANAFNTLLSTTSLVSVRIKVWINEICQVFYSSAISYATFSQNLFNSLGIQQPDIILNNTVWDLSGKISGAWGLKADSEAIIYLFDATKTPDVTTFSIVGTCTIIGVAEGMIIFSAGTLSYLKFKDTDGSQYEFLVCEGNGFVVHNIETTCNLYFEGFYWNLNNEYFGLIYQNFEVLLNSTGTAKVYIPFKNNGSSNYLT